MKKKTSKAKPHAKKPVVVAVSGGFDPLHIGHVRMLLEAKKHGDQLVVILNNDNWLRQKKGFTFMPEKERKEIIAAIRGVDNVILTTHPSNPTDMSVGEELKKLKPDIFVQGGDRKKGLIPPIEVQIMEQLGGKVIYNIGRGGKVQSSSWLSTSFINEVIDRTCPCKSGELFKECGLKNTVQHQEKLKDLLNT